MKSVGVDIGSTATKVALVEDGVLAEVFAMPTGFSGVEASERVRTELARRGCSVDELPVVATGYGRVSVPYAGKVVTEITCHGRGAAYLFGADGMVIDIGGQDTKVIRLAGGRVTRFAMNDKCAAGTGKFLEVMATRMGVSLQELSRLAALGGGVSISSMCTVFAESEVISLVGLGESLESIAHAVVESVVGRVTSLAVQIDGDPCFLTGGLCENAYLVSRLEAVLGRPVRTTPTARYAGAIGAALSATPG